MARIAEPDLMARIAELRLEQERLTSQLNMVSMVSVCVCVYVCVYGCVGVGVHVCMCGCVSMHVCVSWPLW